VTGGGTLRVTVTARQRLALGVGSEVSYYTGTHLFVPGAVLRGALAAAWIAEHGPPHGDGGTAFRELFDGEIRYGPMYLPGTVLVPVSARLCKYPRDADCQAQAVDAAFEAGEDCPACHGPLEPGRGQLLLPPGVAPERITRTSIDPSTAKAADGELYANGTLPAGIRLTGYIRGRAPWLERPRPLRLGGRRTVGGSAEYEAVPVDPAKEKDILAERTGVTPPGGSAGRGGAAPQSAGLVLRLAGPAVFVDAAGRPSLEPDQVLDLDGATVERRWARPVTWSGWHAASHLPKPDEVCAAPGSTYRITGPADTLSRLAERLPRAGAGLRRAEGFGEVRVVRGPWRPPARVTPAGSPAAADAPVRAWLRDLADLALDPPQLRWVADALRELQLGRERRAGQAGDGDQEPVSALLDRAAAGGFSGRQREGLRGLFTEPNPRQLRDLTTLLLAGLDTEDEAG
jgi:CRISPR-associated protein Csx10